MKHSYMKYDDLDYTPSYGTIDVKGENKAWVVAVPVPQGRAMEADGVPVCWVDRTVPEWIPPHANLIRLWLWGYRLLSWPGRFLDNLKKEG